MSKRNDRRAAERTARKIAYQQLRQTPVQPPAPATDLESAVASMSEAALASNPGVACAAAPAMEPSPKPLSQAQLSANQSNPQLSTGPITEAGKAISSRNNTRHGLNSDADGDYFRVLGTESQATYDHELADFRKEWLPYSATEHDLVNRMVMHRWLRRRALRMQNDLFDAMTGKLIDAKQFDLFRRYESQHERGFNKAFADLQRLRSLQTREINGFESQGAKMKSTN